MKNILLLFFLCLTTVLIGQTRQDTVYSRWGQVANIKHFSKIDTDKVSKAYLFQRGLTFGDEAWELDSISTFNDQGKFVRTRKIAELDPIQSDRLPQEKRPTVDLIAAKILKSDLQFIRISGYAAQQHHKTLNFSLTDQGAAQFTIVGGPGNIRIEGLSMPVSPKRHEVNLSVDLPAGYRQQVLHIQGPNGKTYDVRLALRGYDLTEKDFQPGIELPQLKFIDARERENLYLSLESTEKLLSIYQGNKVRYRFPVGRQVDVIPVYQLPAGEYRMEIIDLSTGVKRSYGLRR